VAQAVARMAATIRVARRGTDMEHRGSGIITQL
jgi:hypothetical protein